MCMGSAGAELPAECLHAPHMKGLDRPNRDTLAIRNRQKSRRGIATEACGAPRVQNACPASGPRRLLLRNRAAQPAGKAPVSASRLPDSLRVGGPTRSAPALSIATQEACVVCIRSPASNPQSTMELVSSRSGRRLALLLACVCLRGVGHAPAATVYVAPWGDDANPGAFHQPKRNAQIALNALQPGDTLYFREGLYSLNGPLTLSKSGSPDNWITIASAPGETAVLDGALAARDDDSILEVRGQNYVKIENLRLQNSKDQGISVWKSKHVVIQNNHTYNTYGPGIGVWGDAGAQVPSQYITVWNNKVEKPNSWDAPGEHPNPAPNHPPHEGISLGRVEDFEVAYNEVWGGQKEGIDSKGPNKRGVIHHNYVHDLPRVGIYVDAWTSGIEDIEIHNNIVHDSYSNGLSGLVSINSEDNQTVDDVRVHHNLRYNIKRRIFHVNGSPLTSNVKIWNNNGLGADHGVLLTGNLQDITIENNILNNIRFQILKDDSSGTGRTIGYNLLNANPAFANASSDDYRLAPGSSAIDAGNPDPAYNDPDGSRNDIGAFYLRQTNTSWDYWLGAGWDQGAPPHPWDLNDPGGPGGADPGYEPAVLLFADDFILDPLAPGPVGRGGAAPLPTNGWAESGAWTNSAEPDAQGVVRSVARGLSGSLTRAISTEGSGIEPDNIDASLAMGAPPASRSMRYPGKPLRSKNSPLKACPEAMLPTSTRRVYVRNGSSGVPTSICWSPYSPRSPLPARL